MKKKKIFTIVPLFIAGKKGVRIADHERFVRSERCLDSASVFVLFLFLYKSHLALRKKMVEANLLIFQDNHVVKTVTFRQSLYRFYSCYRIK